MKTDLLPGETTVRDGPANLQRGLETVGGRLHLTDQRLVFESHRFNIQTGVTIIALSEVARLRKTWTKFLGLIPLAPNSLSVHTSAGAEYRFVVWDRKGWIQEIEGRLTPPPGGPAAL